MSFLNTLKNFMTSKDSIENAKKQGELGWSLYIENSSQLNEKIENLLTKSAKKGVAEYQYLLGGIYQENKSTMNKAVYWLKKADKQPDEIGSLPAKSLGEIYQAGIGLPVDMKSAIKWYTRAADLGDADSAYKIAVFYHESNNTPKSKEWCLKAAELGHIESCGIQATSILKNDPSLNGIKKANRYIEKAAKSGHVPSMIIFANNLLHGFCEEKNDAKAFDFMKMASVAWHTQSREAMNNVGEMYLNGVGVPQNISKAVECFQKASEHGNPDSQLNLGRVYLEGIGLKVNLIESIKWYTLALSNGKIAAASALGKIYLKENGEFQQNLIFSFTMFAIAGSEGDQESISYHNNKYKYIQDEQDILKIQDLVAEWSAYIEQGKIYQKRLNTGAELSELVGDIYIPMPFHPHANILD